MDWLIVVLVAAAGIAFLFWAARASGPRGSGMSDADRYQLELARKAQEHTQAQVRLAAAQRPVSPSQRTGYSQASAYRSGPAAGQNVTHGQNLPGFGSGQNAGQFSGQFSGQAGQQWAQVPGLTPQLVAQLQGMVRAGQIIQSISLLHNRTGLGLAEAKSLIERLPPRPLS